MNKSAIIGVIVVVIVIAGGAALWITHKKQTTTNQNSNMNMSSSSNSSNNSSSSSSTPVSTNTVSIKDFAFSPSDITVKKGTSVTWMNGDSTAHTVTESDSQTGPDSGTLDPGKSYSFTFNTVGTFHYHCNFHGNMTGTVTVTE